MTTPPLSPEAERVAEPVAPAGKLFIREMNRILDAKGAGGCPDIPPPDGWDRECVKCAFKWRQSDWGTSCPCCEGDERPPADRSCDGYACECPHHYVQRVSWQCERCGEAMGSDAP